MNKFIITGMGVLVSAIFTLGCGSSSEDAATVLSPRAAFLKQANSVCSKTRTEVKAQAAAWEKAHGSKTIDWDTAWRQVIIPSLKREAAELRGLTVPKELEGDVTQMIKSLSSGIAVFMKNGGPDNFEQFQAEASTLGLKTCSL